MQRAEYLMTLAARTPCSGSLSAFEVSAFEVSAFEVRAFDVSAFDVNAFEVSAFEVRAFDVSAFEVRDSLESSSTTPSGSTAQPTAMHAIASAPRRSMARLFIDYSTIKPSH